MNYYIKILNNYSLEINNCNNEINCNYKIFLDIDYNYFIKKFNFLNFKIDFFNLRKNNYNIIKINNNFIIFDNIYCFIELKFINNKLFEIKITPNIKNINFDKINFYSNNKEIRLYQDKVEFIFNILNKKIKDIINNDNTNNISTYINRDFIECNLFFKKGEKLNEEHEN